MMAFFAGTETAIISANKLKLYAIQDTESPDKNHVSLLLNESHRMLVVTLVGINISLVLGTFCAQEILSYPVIYDYINHFGLKIDVEMLLNVIFLPPLFLIFCEIIPKTIFRIKADKLIQKVTPLLRFSNFVFTPLIMILLTSTNFLLHLFGIKEGVLVNKLTREELIDIVEESEKSGTIEESEKQMIHGIFDLKQRKVKEIMTPLIDVKAINVNKTNIDELKALAQKTGYTRFPIFSDRIINLTGYIELYQIFSSDDIEKKELKDFIQEPYYLPESKKIDMLLEEFLNNRIKMGFVVNEYGSCSGIVTREDILEEIVGEIEDEFDSPAEPIFEYKGDAIICNSLMNIIDVNKNFDLDLPKEDYETIGGFIYNSLEKIPQRNDEVIYGDHKFIVVSMDKQKIKKVKIIKATESEIDDNQ